MDIRILARRNQSNRFDLCSLHDIGYPVFRFTTVLVCRAFRMNAAFDVLHFQLVECVETKSTRSGSNYLAGWLPGSL